MQFVLHEAALKYLCGVNPRAQWKAWGVRGSHVDGDPIAVRAIDGERAFIEVQLRKPEVMEGIEGFSVECLKLFNACLAGDEEAKSPYMSDKKFLFVCGIMRSGGTYIFQELSAGLGIDWEALSFSMSHDTIPSYELVLAHDEPAAYEKLLFEVCQFLVWAKRETVANPCVVQKRIAYGQGIQFVDKLFGPRAEFLITVRHPGAACTSFAEMEGLDEQAMPSSAPQGWKAIVERAEPASAKGWDGLDFRRQFLVFWRAYYGDVVRSGTALDRIHPIVYGDGFPGFVRRMAKRHGRDSNPRPFTARAAIEDIKSLWRARGLELGYLADVL